VLTNPIPTRPSDSLKSSQYVAQKFGVHPATIGRLIKAGKLRAVRISAGRIGIRESEIERYLAENEIPPAA
jgi:excisionase family DNA binding protein